MIGSPLICISTGFADYGDYLGIAFSDPLERLGAVPVVLPYLAEPARLLSRIDGLLLAVGRDLEPWRFGGRPHPSLTLHSPRRDETELAMAREAITARVPLLGICRGMQVINVALGGALYPDHRTLRGRARAHPGGDWGRWEEVVSARLERAEPPSHPEHEIAISAGSLLGSRLGVRAVVNSYHHQGVARLGAGVQVTARAPDGVIEAIEVPSAGAMCLGVQWELQEQPDSPLFELLVDHARNHAAMKKQRTVSRTVGERAEAQATTHGTPQNNQAAGRVGRER